MLRMLVVKLADPQPRNAREEISKTDMCRHAAFSRRLRSLANFVPAVVASRAQGLTTPSYFWRR